MQQNNIALTSVVNIEKLSSLFKNFSEATGLTVGMLEHPSQDILFMHGCSDVCLYFHRTVPDHPDFCTIKFLNKDNKNTLPGESYVGCCPNGMNHGCIAVNINNIQVASIFIGQVFFNKPDLDYFEKQAVRYGFNVEDYLNKIIKVPIIERYKFNSYLEYLRGLALIITEMNNAKLSDQNKKLQLEIKEHNLKNEILTRREVERILKETQIKFLAISEAAKDVIILIDSKGEVTYCNPAIEKVFGYKCTEILGKPIHKIIAPKSYHEKAKEKFDIFVRTGKGDVLNKTLELPALKKDRTELMVELSVSPLMLDNQWNAIGIIRDITHRKELEKQLEEERTNLKSTVEEKTRELKLSLKNLEYTNMFLNEANSHKTRFLQSISHELRTPLNAIIGFTQLLSQQIYGELNDTQADYINLISENSNSLLHMINNLLSITQIDAGTMEMKRENIPLDDFIRDMHKILLHKFKVKNINFTYKINSPGFMLNVDKLKLRQIIYNLLSNARKYTQDNGSVELVVDKCADKIIISVIDNGIGVREENREKIFESFFKENMNGNQLNHGAGIGLTLARRLVSMHNGQLTLDDKDGKGSKFSVHLPLEV